MKYIITDTICALTKVQAGGSTYPIINTKIIAICSIKEKAEEIKEKTKQSVKEIGVYHNIDISEVEEC